MKRSLTALGFVLALSACGVRESVGPSGGITTLERESWRAALGVQEWVLVPPAGTNRLELEWAEPGVEAQSFSMEGFAEGERAVVFLMPTGERSYRLAVVHGGSVWHGEREWSRAVEEAGREALGGRIEAFPAELSAWEWADGATGRLTAHFVAAGE